MTDWIDRLKTRQQQEQSRDDRREQIRLHKAAVFRAKMPLFWSKLTECIVNDCKRLRHEFPDNQRYHCTLDRHDDREFLLTNTVNPRIWLTVKFNEDGQFIEIEDSQQLNIASGSSRHTQTLDIEVTDRDDLLIRNTRLGQPITVPEELSEHLCRRACQIL